ncbi:hypothetical protein VDGL01_01593 [Verticillium dahliae]
MGPSSHNKTMNGGDAARELVPVAGFGRFSETCFWLEPVFSVLDSLNTSCWSREVSDGVVEEGEGRRDPAKRNRNLEGGAMGGSLTLKRPREIWMRKRIKKGQDQAGCHDRTRQTNQTTYLSVEGKGHRTWTRLARMGRWQLWHTWKAPVMCTQALGAKPKESAKHQQLPHNVQGREKPSTHAEHAKQMPLPSSLLP